MFDEAVDLFVDRLIGLRRARSLARDPAEGLWPDEDEARSDARYANLPPEPASFLPTNA